jgi:CPA2 family monovalent cation:H+ antiporter-2
MALNAALIAAVFIAAAFVERQPPEWLQRLQIGNEWLKSALWLAAFLLSLPMFIATARKLQALGILLAETRVSEAAAGERTAPIRSFVATVVPMVGTVVMGIYVVMLGSALLPTFRVFIVLLLLAALIGWLLRRSFVRVYSKAQIALQETLAEAPAHGHAPSPLPALLRNANLELVAIQPQALAVGKLIRELELRTQTGASIVGIERDGGSVINPGPNEELLAHDQVLLLGTQQQLDAARTVLNNSQNEKS